MQRKFEETLGDQNKVCFNYHQKFIQKNKKDLRLTLGDTNIYLFIFPFLFILFYYYFFKFYFIFKLYKIVLVLPNIKMNPPQVYMCSPS